MRSPLWLLLSATLLLSLGLTSGAKAAAAPRAKDGGSFSYPPRLPEAREETYKTVDGVALKLYIFNPAPAQPDSHRRPAIVFFFGGGWTSGSPSQFQRCCAYLAARGMVAITADYRVASRHHVPAVACVRDAKSAIRWVRAQATRLGIDPQRIAAGGGSAGGHLAAAVALVPGLEEAGEDPHISSVPNALVLFNPALVLAPFANLNDERLQTLLTVDRCGIEPVRISPIHHVRAGAPPTIIFHGQADTTVPYASTEAFDRVMRQAGNRCELIGYPGQTHGFFNFGRGGNECFRDTLRRTDRFLGTLGWLQGEPNVDAFFAAQGSDR